MNACCVPVLFFLVSLLSTSPFIQAVSAASHVVRTIRGLNHVSSLAVDAAGDLYAVDNERVIEFSTATGELVHDCFPTDLLPGDQDALRCTSLSLFPMAV